MNEKLSSIAVLIDADNTSASVIDEIFEKINKFGEVKTKRIYGDWGQSNLKSWQGAILKHAITPIQQFAYTKGKNATDINMVIDAMELLINGEYDGFCLVSSDSDFAPLASKLREKKFKVFGFGKKNTPESFRMSCDQFIYVNPVKELPPENDKSIPKKLKELILDIISEESDQDGGIKIELLASHIRRRDNDFSSKKYGFPKFTLLINTIAEIEVKRVGTGYVCYRKDNKNDNKNSNNQNNNIEPVSPPVIKESKPFTEKEKEIVLNLITEKTVANADDQGWVNISIGAIGNMLKTNNFDYQDYGFAKLSMLLKLIPELELQSDVSGICRFHNKKAISKQPDKVQEKAISPKYSLAQIKQAVFIILKDSTHKKRWVSLSYIEYNLKKLDANFNPKDYDFNSLSDLLDSLGLQSLEVSHLQEKYYRKVPFLELIEQLKKVTQRTDIDLRESDGRIKACALGHYAHFHVHYGKYGFDSFFSFFEEVMAYRNRKQNNNE